MPEYHSDTETDINHQGNDNVQQNIPWTEAHENILVEWADKALCYRWLHSKAHQQYTASNTWFTIPVIIMSTVTGTANFAQDKFPESIRGYATMGIGAVNIFAGILTTISQFLKISELNEAHRVSGISWDKFYRNIKVELAKSPDERIPVLQMLKISKEEFDRLMETSPAISDSITNLFQETFTDGNQLGDIPEEQLSRKQKLFAALKKPEICDELVSCKQFVFKVSAKDKAKNTLKGNISLAKKAYQQKQSIDKINTIIKHFLGSRQRMPTEDEIYNEVSDDGIELETIITTLSKFNNENIVIKDNSNNV
jgi:hypothetical protein